MAGTAGRSLARSEEERLFLSRLNELAGAPPNDEELALFEVWLFYPQLVVTLTTERLEDMRSRAIAEAAQTRQPDAAVVPLATR